MKIGNVTEMESRDRRVLDHERQGKSTPLARRGCGFSRRDVCRLENILERSGRTSCKSRLENSNSHLWRTRCIIAAASFEGIIDHYREGDGGQTGYQNYCEGYHST